MKTFSYETYCGLEGIDRKMLHRLTFNATISYKMLAGSVAAPRGQQQPGSYLQWRRRLPPRRCSPGPRPARGWRGCRAAAAGARCGATCWLWRGRAATEWSPAATRHHRTAPLSPLPGTIHQEYQDSFPGLFSHCSTSIEMCPRQCDGLIWTQKPCQKPDQLQIPMLPRFGQWDKMTP